MIALILAIILFATPTLGMNLHSAMMMVTKQQAIACSSSTDEVGNRTEITSIAAALEQQDMYCVIYTPDCTSGCTTGTLGYAYLYHNSTGSDNAKVCVYSDDGDGIRNVDDLKIACSGVMASSSAEWKKSTDKLTGSITCASPYWLCVTTDNTQWTIGYKNTGDKSAKVQVSDSMYTSPPDNLTGTWDAYDASMDWSVYVEIE